MRKMFEKGTMRNHINKWVKNCNIIDDLQGANQEHCSSLETNWMVRETLHHYIDRKSNIFLCMLDVQKAFDSVWQAALFYKLYNAGMDPKLWRIIVDMYHKPECTIRIGNNLSEWIVAKTGIIQGGPMSMLNYEMIGNDLIKELKQCNAGTVIGDIVTTSPAFADDLVIMAPSRRGLQRLLDVAHDHSSKWRYNYNAKKCAILAFTQNEQDEQPFQLGEERIKVIQSHDHVGTILSTSKWDIIKYVKQRIEACNKPGYAIMSIGSKIAPMSPKSAANLYWSICIPKLTYGCQVMDLPEEALVVAEGYHAKMAKVFQCLPDQSSNFGAVACMGWMSVRGYIEMMTLLFFMRIINLPMECIYKRLLIRRYCYLTYDDNVAQSGPLWSFISLCKKYDLHIIVTDAIENSVYVSKSVWKKMISLKILDYENKKWAVNSTLFRTLKLVKDVLPCITMLTWWNYCQQSTINVRKCRTIVRILLDCHGLKSCRFRYNLVADPICEHCDMRAIEDAEHVLFICKENHEARQRLWNQIVKQCPEQLSVELSSMTISEKMIFLFSGLGGAYIDEWIPIYSAVLNYIHELYVTRTTKQDCIDP